MAGGSWISPVVNEGLQLKKPPPVALLRLC